VVVPPASQSFVHYAVPDNTISNSTYLDNALTNGDPNAGLSVTQNWNPGGGWGVYNDHPIGVRYDQAVQKWAIYNQDGTPMPNGAAFNVAVSGNSEPARQIELRNDGVLGSSQPALLCSGTLASAVDKRSVP
jgi:hypothetical protein